MINNNSLYNSPIKQVHNFHEITDIDQRKSFLQGLLNEDPDKNIDYAPEEPLTKQQISYYLELLESRYEKRGSQYIDRYMRAFMMLLTSNRSSGLGFFTKKRKKETEGFLNDFKLDEYSDPSTSDEKKAMIKEEWADCAACYISSCTSSKAYGSAFLGMIPMPDKNVAIKIAADIDTALNEVPQTYDLDKRSLPIYEVFVDTYKTLLENGESLFREYILGKR